jgi:ferrous iron transport protein A
LTFIFNKSDSRDVPTDCATLADLAIGVAAKIAHVDDSSDVVRRLMEMGLVRGAPVLVRKVAPLGDPMELSVRGYLLSIRKSEARYFGVEIVP